MVEPRPNLVALLHELGRRADRPAFALRTPYRRFIWTGGEIRTAALAGASRLAAAGLGRGEPVLLLGPNSPEWVAAFFAIIAAGGVAVPLDAAASSGFCRGVAARVGARAAFAAAGRADTLRDAISRVETLESFETLRSAPAPLSAPYEAAPGDTAEIVFTSGTTSEPKGVELSHANLLVNLATIETGFRRYRPLLRPLLPMRLFSFVPLSHMLGQSVGLFIPILLESTGIFSSTLLPARLSTAIRRERPLILLTVPRVLAGLAEALRREMARRGCLDRFEAARRRTATANPVRRVLATREIRRILGWRTWAIVVGGAALDPDVEEFWTGCGFFLIQGYGMTEAAPIIAVHNPLDGARRTIGTAIGSQEVRLAPDGEILVRGPNIMKGYWRDTAATNEALRDGWLHTGDLGEQDSAGRFFFKGRKKDVIVTADGMNVHPSDIETALAAVPGVKSAVAFGLAGLQGEEVHAAIVPARPSLDPDTVRVEANGSLLPHQRLRGVIVWDAPDFPRTGTGKVRRGEVAAVALALRSGREARSPAGGPCGTGAPDTGATGAPTVGTAQLRPGPADGPGPSRVLAALDRIRVGASSGAGEKARLAEDLGLSSLEIVELVGLLEEEHGVAIDDRQMAAALTVGDLDRLVAQGGQDALRLSIPRWTQRAPARWLRAALRLVLVRPALMLFARLTIEGREHLRGLSPPFLVIANHTSVADAAVILFALPRRLRSCLAPAMAIETLPEHFEPEGKSFVRRARAAVLYNFAVLLFGAYPMPQTRGFRPSLEYTGELIDKGLSPLVFPEGEMTRVGRMLPFKRGIGLLALETRVPIVPVWLEGVGAILPPDTAWPRRGRARVVIGAPLDPPDPLRDNPVSVTARLEETVRGLGDRS